MTLCEMRRNCPFEAESRGTHAAMLVEHLMFSISRRIGAMEREGTAAFSQAGPTRLGQRPTGIVSLLTGSGWCMMRLLEDEE